MFTIPLPFECGLQKYREMKVYEWSGYNYQNTLTIMLKWKWLQELGRVKCTP
mgnify:CR=1 FL=1